MIREKIISNKKGASMVFALMVFIVCATIGTILITYASASAGKLSEIKERESSYYAVESVLKQIGDEIANVKIYNYDAKKADAILQTELAETTLDSIVPFYNKALKHAITNDEDGTAEFTVVFPTGGYKVSGTLTVNKDDYSVTVQINKVSIAKDITGESDVEKELGMPGISTLKVETRKVKMTNDGKLSLEYGDVVII